MDCRISSALIVGCLMLAGGCTSTQKLPEPPPGAKVVKGKDAKRTPRAETVVALAVMKEREADQAPEDPDLQQRLRDQARRAFQEAVKVDGKCVAAYSGLGRVYLKQGDVDRALETYQKGVTKLPGEASLWIDLAMCHNRRKDWDSAIAALNQVIKADPENRQAIQTLAYTLARAGRAEEAVACFQKITAGANAHYQVARMLQHMRQEQACRQHLQMALHANPQFQPAQEMLAQLEQGNTPAGAEEPTTVQ